MRNVLSESLFVFVGLLTSNAFGSGFKCDGEGYSVQYYNQVDPQLGTRNPAALIVSSEAGTLLVRKGGAIRKNTRANTTQYVVEGNRQLDADTAILQIAFKEGVEVLAKGETVDGQLILVQDGQRIVFELSCARYLTQE